MLTSNWTKGKEKEDLFN